MVQVCEGTSTKNDMLVRSLEQYKHMYIVVKREFEKVTSVSSPLLLLVLEVVIFAECASTLSGSGGCTEWSGRWWW